MNDYKKMKMYFASPWFNETQDEREQRVKSILRSLGFDLFSPRETSSGMSPITDPLIQNKIYEANVTNMIECDLFFAITDEKDMGTIWEAGFINGLKVLWEHQGIASPNKIIYYCETLGDGMFNLMLAKSADIVITKFEDLYKLPQMITNGEDAKYDGFTE